MKFNQNFPSLQQPLTGPNGCVNQSWQQFFLSLWNRTGAAEAAVDAVQVQYSEQGSSSLTSPVGQLAEIPAGEVLANITNSRAIPSPSALSTILDAVFGNVRGALLTRTASGWQSLSPGTDAYVLTTHGTTADVDWEAVQGLPIIADKDLLANLSGTPAIPVAHTLGEVLDYVLGAVDGDVVYRTAGVWTIANLNSLIVSGTSTVNYHPGFQTGRFYTGPSSSIGGSGTMGMTSNLIYAIPFFSSQAISFTSAAIFIASFTSTGNLEFGLYSNNNGVPSTKLQDIGTLAVTATGLKTVSAAVPVPAGWCWLVIAQSGGLFTVGSVAGAGMASWFLGSTNPSSTPFNSLTGAWTFSAGNLPTNFPTPLSYINAAPAVSLGL